MEGKEEPTKKHAAVEAIGSSKKAEQRPESARYYQVWWLVFLLLFLYMYFDQYVFYAGACFRAGDYKGESFWLYTSLLLIFSIFKSNDIHDGFAIPRYSFVTMCASVSICELDAFVWAIELFPILVIATMLLSFPYKSVAKSSKSAEET